MGETLTAFCHTRNRTELLAQWDRQANLPLTPEAISYGSTKKVWWRCSLGHEWQAEIRSRTDGCGCPVCANRAVARGINDLASQLPELAREWHPGGFLLFGRDFKNRTPEELRTLLASLQETSPIPLLLGVDEEGGTVVRASYYPAFRAEKFRSPQALFAAGGLEAVRADALDKSAFLLDLGLNVNLAPVCDVSTDPADFIYARAFGQDAQATAEYADTVVSAMGEAGIGSVLKHFPGYGSNRDTHTGIAVDQRPLEQFRQSDFLPFQAGIDAGAGGVLVSHNIMAAVDDTLPASLSPAVHDLLREQLGFDGVVMTDDLAMEAVAAYSADGAVAVMALEAGNDLIITTDYRTQIPKVLEAVENGTLSMDTIDTACRRVLTWKQALGLL